MNPVMKRMASEIMASSTVLMLYDLYIRGVGVILRLLFKYLHSNYAHVLLKQCGEFLFLISLLHKLLKK